MATLTTAQRSRFTTAQLVQVDKLPDIAGSVAQRDAILLKWARKSPQQLRAKVCLGSVSWASSGPTITWSARSDLSTAEQQAVQDLLVPGRKYEDVAVEVIAGRRSVEQRLTAGGL